MPTPQNQPRRPLRRPKSPQPHSLPFKCANPTCIAAKDRLRAITLAYAAAANRHRTTTETISLFRPRFPITRTTIVQRPSSTSSTSATPSPPESPRAPTPTPPQVLKDNLHPHADSETRPDPATNAKDLAKGHQTSAKASSARKNVKIKKCLSTFATIITHLFI